MRKNTKKPSEELQDCIQDIEYELNDDDSITPKDNLPGWDSYPWTCDNCQLVFSVSEELKDHFATVHNASARYICADCPKVYTKYMTFIVHIKSHRPNLKFCCDVCYKWFGTAAIQEQHRSMEHGEYDCPTCGKRFKMQSILQVNLMLPVLISRFFCCYMPFLAERMQKIQWYFITFW